MPQRHPRRVVVIGHGLIGSAVTRTSLRRGHPTVVMIRNPPTSIPADVTAHVVDDFRSSIDEVIRDEDLVVAAYGPAQPRAKARQMNTLVDSLTSPASDIVECLDVRAGVRLVWFSSGGSVYGSSSTPVDEEQPLRPSTPYGVAKAAEELVLGLAATRSNSAIALRCSTVYGSRTHHSPTQGLVQLALERLRTGRPISLFGQGQAVRGYLHVDDLAEIAMRVGTSADPRAVYNVCSGETMSTCEVVERVSNALGLVPNIEFAETPDADIVLSTKRLREYLGPLAFRAFEPAVTAMWASLRHTE